VGRSHELCALPAGMHRRPRVRYCPLREVTIDPPVVRSWVRAQWTGRAEGTAVRRERAEPRRGSFLSPSSTPAARGFPVLDRQETLSRNKRTGLGWSSWTPTITPSCTSEDSSTSWGWGVAPSRNPTRDRRDICRNLDDMAFILLTNGDQVGAAGRNGFRPARLSCHVRCAWSQCFPPSILRRPIWRAEWTADHRSCTCARRNGFSKHLEAVLTKLRSERRWYSP
jgi:hypothetical protein